MAVIQFSFTNYADIATLSGGLWQATLPASNMQIRPLSRVARSQDVLATSTRVDIDLGDDRKVIRLIGLLRHSISTEGTWQITAGTTPGGSDLFDSGALDVWPAVYLPADLEWEDDNWWTGQISAEDAALYPINAYHDAGANIRARYWRVQVTDTTNSAGYIDVGRLWLGPVWAPGVSYQLGAGLQWEPQSEAERSLGGVQYFDGRPSLRVFRFSFGALSNAEAWGKVLDAQRVVRNDKEIIVIPDADDAQRAHRRNIYGRLRALDPIIQASYNLQSTGYEVEELL